MILASGWLLLLFSGCFEALAWLKALTGFGSFTVTGK
jgi:hypothetical protein